jgi:phosphotransferase system enzyme I (PtsI)
MKKIKGIGVSSGYAYGKACIIRSAEVDVNSSVYSSAEEEIGRFQRAVSDYIKETQALMEGLTRSAGKKNADILEGHITMINDPFMLSQVNDSIKAGKTAEQAVDEVCKNFYDMFSAVDDEMMKQRASDILDIRNSVVEILSGVRSTIIEDVPKGTILVAKDFTPSMTSRINHENVYAIIAEAGSVTSHSAILARATDMPAVLSVADATKIISDGDKLALDGGTGKILLDPDEKTIAEYEKKREDYFKEKAALAEYFGKETVTKGGIKKAVYANIGKPEDVEGAKHNGAEGIGLFRTEFLFLDRPSLPTEEEQYEAYSTVAKSMPDKEVIIRTLDIGGDKSLDYLKIPSEENPFLGYRAIRYCLDNPDVFKIQLRALLRAARFGNIKIMLPMITDLEEVYATKALIAECEKELGEAGIPFKKDVPVGVMIETPAAVFIADELAKEVEFFSIGTNDLTGYVMAADRGNAKVSNLYSVHKKAVVKAIEMTIAAAKAAGIQVGMCGEAAADRELIPSLVKWGLDEFSVTPNSVLATRKAICECE